MIWYHCHYEKKLQHPLLTHLGRVTHICVIKLNLIGSDNGLSPGRCQAIIWTNDGILLIGSLGTNFSDILIEIDTFSFKKIAFENVLWKMATILSRPQCVKPVMVWSSFFKVPVSWLYSRKSSTLMSVELPALQCRCSDGWRQILNYLNDWVRETHKYVSELGPRLSPVRHQAIIWTNTGISLIGTLGTYFSEILIKILPFSFNKMHLKI